MAGRDDWQDARPPEDGGDLNRGGWDAVADDWQGGALAPIEDDDRALALYDEPEPALIIPGTGTPAGNPFIRRRQRPLSMRLAVITITACVVITGLFSITPLSSNAEYHNAFQALVGAVAWSATPNYHWYTVQWGDTPETIAHKFGVTIGGIYELNHLVVGQDLQVGTALKISDDNSYGAYYTAPAPAFPVSGNGSTVFGTDWWSSLAGTPLPEQPCAPNGNGNPLGYDFVSPNPGSFWVRGYTWFHNGVDIARQQGAPIHAAQAGVVIWSGWTNYGFGYSVVISHCYYLSTLYGHMEKLVVHAGQFVSAGQIIGFEGMTGWATGPHLHLSVLVHNQFVNPMLYFSSVYTLTHGA